MHPITSTRYKLEFTGAANLSPTDFTACLNLIEETSGEDYRASTRGWDRVGKADEMKAPELRYVLVRSQGDGVSVGDVKGFTSLMPTYEEGQAVVYCYEIHLKEELRG
jgi:hypothetical protein